MGVFVCAVFVLITGASFAERIGVEGTAGGRVAKQAIFSSRNVFPGVQSGVVAHASLRGEPSMLWIGTLFLNSFGGRAVMAHFLHMPRQIRIRHRLAAGRAGSRCSRHGICKDC